MKVRVTDREGSQSEIAFQEGDNLMHLLRAHNLVEAECDGNCACATCHVYVAQEWLDDLGALGSEEEMMLDGACEPEDNSRLACQVRLTAAHAGLDITVAPEWS